MITTPAKKRYTMQSCLKNGVFHVTSSDGVFHFDNIGETGWIVITSIGSENLYFMFKDDLGNPHAGYCKCL